MIKSSSSSFINKNSSWKDNSNRNNIIVNKRISRLFVKQQKKQKRKRYVFISIVRLIGFCLVVSWILLIVSVVILDNVQFNTNNQSSGQYRQLRQQQQVPFLKNISNETTSTNNSINKYSETIGTTKRKNITVILMNHNRPQLLLQSQLLYTFVIHRNITTIIICHSNPYTIFNNTHLLEMYNFNNYMQQNKSNNNVLEDESGSSIYESLLQQKVIHINAIKENKLYGLSLRFYFCQTTISIIPGSSSSLSNNNDWIIQVDDDMDINSKSIDLLVYYMSNNSKRIVGYYGRSYNYYRYPYKYGYDTTWYKNTTNEVILTKLLISERILCNKFFTYKYIIEDTNNQELFNTSHPKWNGEDIFFNLVSNYYYYSTTNTTTSTNENNKKKGTTSLLRNTKEDEIYNNYAIYSQQYNRTSTTDAYVNEVSDDLQQFPLITLLEDNDKTNNNNNTSSTRKFQTIINFIKNQNQQNYNQNQNQQQSVSGNVDKIQFWNLSLLLPAIIKAFIHSRYRGKLWYITKQYFLSIQQQQK